MMENFSKFATGQRRLILTNTRSSRSHMLHKKGILKNFVKLHGKITLLESLFNKSASLRHSTLCKMYGSTDVFL